VRRREGRGQGIRERRKSTASAARVRSSPEVKGRGRTAEGDGLTSLRPAKRSPAVRVLATLVVIFDTIVIACA